jgi:hypothetical protein
VTNPGYARFVHGAASEESRSSRACDATVRREDSHSQNSHESRFAFTATNLRVNGQIGFVAIRYASSDGYEE